MFCNFYYELLFNALGTCFDFLKKQNKTLEYTAILMALLLSVKEWCSNLIHSLRLYSAINLFNAEPAIF